MNWNKTAKWLRIIILVGLLVWITVEAYLHQVYGGAKVPSVHALCPFGALESLYSLLFFGSFIKKIFMGTVILLVLTVALAVLFRRSFCGLLCPFGTLQELFARLGQKIFKKRFTVPPFVDKPLRYLKYLILALTIGMAWYTGTLWMAPYDPYSAYSHLSAVSASIQEDPAAIVGFILLIVTLIGSLLYDRFFCKYLCPAGAFYAIIGKISPTKIVRNNQACINCKACNKACPVNINVAKAEKITDAECLNCNECVLACPKKGALEVKTANKVIHPLTALILVVFLFFGTIAIAQATGNYQVTSSPQKGEIVSITEVKGSYTIEDAAEATGLPLQEIYEKLSIPESVSKNTKLKDISKEIPGYSLDETKEKL
ncbi:MAG: 4Fe-4S binding protein [Candidatus Dehalobacter alkaniphilus]